jgi:hypothetical protein
MINLRKDKTKINLTIDALMLLLLMAIAGLGFLIKYVLVPGYKRNLIYDGNAELNFMGLTRHHWGSIHLGLSLFFLFLLFLHIILHWKLIGCIFRQMISGKALRKCIAAFVGVACLFLALAPLFVKPDITTMPHNPVRSHTSYRSLKINPESAANDEQKLSKEIPGKVIYEKPEEKRCKHSHHEIEVYGHMTIKEVSEKYEISLEELKKILNIPTGQSDHRIGRLKNQYGFQMSDVRNAILKIKKE